jgi:hypothetical protein
LPWCRSAWKKPSTTAWRRKARTRIGQGLAIVAGRDQRLAVVELDAVEPFERQDPAGGRRQSISGK